MTPLLTKGGRAFVRVTHTKRVREAHPQRENKESKRSTIHTKTKREYHVIHTEQQCYTHNDVNRYGVNIYQLDTGWG